MRVTRLCKHKYKALDGIGASVSGGRWNSKGLPVLYTASCGALAALEFRVHARELPKDMMLLLWIELSEEITIQEVSYNPGSETVSRQIGDQWLQSRNTVALRVPSALVPRQWNLLLNPGHPDFATFIQDVSDSSFAYDPNLFVQ